MVTKTVSCGCCGQNWDGEIPQCRCFHTPGPDLAGAYIAMAPLVAESLAFLSSGDIDRARVSLMKANDIIKLVNTNIVVIPPENLNPVQEKSNPND